MVPADMRVLRSQNLVVNETVLTGESIAVPKRPELLLSNRRRYMRATTPVSPALLSSGEAVAVVVETGVRTAMGTIAKLTVETTKESEFSKGIGRFSRFILRMILVTLVFVFVGKPAPEGRLGGYHRTGGLLHRARGQRGPGASSCRDDGVALEGGP